MPCSIPDYMMCPTLHRAQGDYMTIVSLITSVTNEPTDCTHFFLFFAFYTWVHLLRLVKAVWYRESASRAGPGENIYIHWTFFPPFKSEDDIENKVMNSWFVFKSVCFLNLWCPHFCLNKIKEQYFETKKMMMPNLHMKDVWYIMKKYVWCLLFLTLVKKRKERNVALAVVSWGWTCKCVCMRVRKLIHWYICEKFNKTNRRLMPRYEGNLWLDDQRHQCALQKKYK